MPRQGAAIASHWQFPDSDEWGVFKGRRFGAATAAYFRTAVHEIGHAMGLPHAPEGLMNTTEAIAGAGRTSGNHFPDNIDWSFAPEQQAMLRHGPDIFVRPGGSPYEMGHGLVLLRRPETVTNPAEGLELRVSPLLDEVPRGAPVRIEVQLVNTSDSSPSDYVPASLSMKDGCLHGAVRDPDGVTARNFEPLMRHMRSHAVVKLAPAQHIDHSITLLRGPQGNLFPVPGNYLISVEERWQRYEKTISVVGTMQVGVIDLNDAQMSIADMIVDAPDLFLLIVLGGDHLERGIAMMQLALQNPDLRPHFACIEAKRLAILAVRRMGSLRAAADLIDDSTVMSAFEIRKLALIIKDRRSDRDAMRISAVLKRKAEDGNLSDMTRELVYSL